MTSGMMAEDRTTVRDGGSAGGSCAMYLLGVDEQNQGKLKNPALWRTVYAWDKYKLAHKVTGC